MDPVLRIIFVVYCSIVLQEVCSQITAPIETENNCFNGIMKANCSQSTGRAFVTQLNAGCKFTSLYSFTDTSFCPYSWTTTVADGCCDRDADDCFGEYNPVGTDPYVYHKDCIGKNVCTQRPAVRMDSIYLNCNASIYPAQTTYFYMNYYCIDINTIGEFTNANKENDGAGSTLYLWSGTITSYPLLPVATYTCSVETDCEDTITVTNLDFRLSDNDANQTCFDDNILTITDSGVSQEFSCATSNNNFEIKTLYTSTSNYITILYTGTNAGGYLWLALKSSSNGNLTLNCQSPTQINVCVTTTEPSTTTTEQTTTTTEPETTTEQETTTTEPTTTTTEPTTTTTESTTTTTEQETTTEPETISTESTTLTTAQITTNNMTTEKSSPPFSNKKPTVVIIISVVVIIISLAALVLIIVWYRKYKQNKIKKGDVENHDQQNEGIESSEVMTNKDFTSSIGTSNDKLLPAISRTHVINGRQDTTKHLEEPKQEMHTERLEEIPTIPSNLTPVNHLSQEDNAMKKRKKKRRKKKIRDDSGECMNSETKHPVDISLQEEKNGDGGIEENKVDNLNTVYVRDGGIEENKDDNLNTVGDGGIEENKVDNLNTVGDGGIEENKVDNLNTVGDGGIEENKVDNLNTVGDGGIEENKVDNLNTVNKFNDDNKSNQVNSNNMNIMLEEEDHVVDKPTIIESENESKPEKERKKKKKRKKNKSSRVHLSEADQINDQVYDMPTHVTNENDKYYQKHEQKETQDDFTATDYRTESLENTQEKRKKKKKKKKTHEKLDEEISEIQ